MAMDPPPSDQTGSRRPYPVPPRPDADDAPRERVHARDLIDRLPEPDPRLLRDQQGPTGEHRSRQRRGGRRGRRSWPQRILLSLFILFAMVAGTAAGLAGYLGHKLDQITYVSVELSAPTDPGAPRNYLIVGSDSRDSLVEANDAVELDPDAFLGDGSVGSGQRSDTIIVVRVDPGTEAVDVLSIPRDLWVAIPGTGRSQRINTAYAGGPQRLVDTIEENFDLPIHHYVEVDFVGFAGLVSAVGGVPMWFDAPVRDQNSGLHIGEAGCHVLDAQAALAFARSRHLEYQTDSGRWSTDGTGDLGRINRQHVFLRRAVDQVSSLSLADAFTFNRLLDVAVDSLTLDRTLGLGHLRDLASRFADFDSDAMRTHALPTYPFRTSGGAAVLGLEEAEAQPALNVFRGLPAGTLAPVQVQSVTVLNGTGEEGKAALVGDALEQVGFGIVGIDNVDPEGTGEQRRVRTTIRHAPDAAASADLLERHLTAGARIVVDHSLDSGEVVLEVGTDLTTVGRNARPPAPGSTTTTSAVPAGTDPDRDTTSTPTSTEPSAGVVGYSPDPTSRCA